MSDSTQKLNVMAGTTDILANCAVEQCVSSRYVALPRQEKEASENAPETPWKR